MSKYPRYPEYKESGVEWLGEIPSKWKVTPIKHLGFLKGGAGFPHSKQGVQGEILDFHKVNALGSADPHGCLVNSKNTISAATASELGAHVFPPYSIVFAKVGAALLLGRIRQLKKAACIDNNMMGLVVREQHDTDFIKYVMHLVRFDYIVNPGAVPSLNEFTMGNSLLVTPSREEQRAIVSFLDHETAKIDTLIEKQQQLIKLLKEKRQAVISHAVTKGLNPDAPMKDSGVEWLGEVPEHWALPKVTQLSKVSNGSTPDKNNITYWQDGSIPWLASTCLNETEVFSSVEFITDKALASTSVQLIPANSVLVGMVGQGKTRGSSSILRFESCINQNMAAIIPDKRMICDFLFFTFQAMYEDLRELGRGGNQAALNCEIIGAIKIPTPPVDEQLRIINYLNSNLTQIDKTIDRCVMQIDLLKERRTALISAAVTGKIDVRNWQPGNQPAQAHAS